MVTPPRSRHAHSLSLLLAQPQPYVEAHYIEIVARLEKQLTSLQKDYDAVSEAASKGSQRAAEAEVSPACTYEGIPDLIPYTEVAMLAAQSRLMAVQERGTSSNVAAASITTAREDSFTASREADAVLGDNKASDVIADFVL